LSCHWAPLKRAWPHPHGGSFCKKEKKGVKLASSLKKKVKKKI